MEGDVCVIASTLLNNNTICCKERDSIANHSEYDLFSSAIAMNAQIESSQRVVFLKGLLQTVCMRIISMMNSFMPI